MSISTAPMMTRRYALRDDPWERIQDLLPGSKGWVGVTAKNNRLFVDAVRYRYRAGIPRRDWPDRVGHDRKIHPRFRHWAKTGLWERVFATCDALGNPTGFHLTPGQACDLDGADLRISLPNSSNIEPLPPVTINWPKPFSAPLTWPHPSSGLFDDTP